MEVEASVIGWLAMADAEKTEEESRRLAIKIRDIVFSWELKSTHHHDEHKQYDLSTIKFKTFIFNYLTDFSVVVVDFYQNASRAAVLGCPLCCFAAAGQAANQARKECLVCHAFHRFVERHLDYAGSCAGAHAENGVMVA
uniref:Uncharacterized protein n=1 Tax=mine drainage metagenome TaxID=410659 RepID=E6QL67_9ZZZZ